MTVEYLLPLYLLVAANFISETFACRLQKVLRESMAAKYIIILLSIVFVIIVQKPDIENEKVSDIVLQSAALFALFVMSTRLPFSVLLAVIVLLGVVYILHLRKTRAQGRGDEVRAAGAERSQKIVSYVAIGIIVVGFFVYMVEKRMEYGKQFRIGTFLIGKPVCRGYTSARARIL